MDVRHIGIAAAAGVGIVGGAVLIHELRDRDNDNDNTIPLAPGPFRTSPSPLEAASTPAATAGAAAIERAPQPPATVPATAAVGTPAAPAPAQAGGLIPVAVASVGPRGMEARGTRFVHVVQQGQTLSSIARAYGETFPMAVTYKQVHAANRAAIGADPGRIRPGQVLTVPGLQVTAEKIMRENPSLTTVHGLMIHEVRTGDTLSKLARHYNASFGLSMTWQDIYAANREYIGRDPGVIRSGQVLAIPGVTKPASTGAPQGPAGPDPVPAGTTLDSLHRKVLAVRHNVVENEDGTRADIEVMRYRFDASKAEAAGRNYTDALDMARRLFTFEPERGTSYGVVKTSSGEFWVGPMQGEEVSENLDDSQRTVSHRMDRPTTAIRAFVQPSFEQLWGA